MNALMRSNVIIYLCWWTIRYTLLMKPQPAGHRKFYSRKKTNICIIKFISYVLKVVSRVKISIVRKSVCEKEKEWWVDTRNGYKIEWCCIWIARELVSGLGRDDLVSEVRHMHSASVQFKLCVYWLHITRTSPHSEYRNNYLPLKIFYINVLFVFSFAPEMSLCDLLFTVKRWE